MNPLEIQNSIKNNADELEDFLQDLRIWEKDIKLKDQELSNENKINIEKSDIPPIRKKKSNSVSTTMKENSDLEKKTNGSMEKTNITEEKVKKARISSYDYAAWEKFDVDKALESESEESVPENNVQLVDGQNKGNKNNEESVQKVQMKNDLNISKNSERAEKLKEQGNVCYSKGNFNDAIAKYTQGMGIDPKNKFLPANRAMAYLKLKKFKAAEKDCTKALELDSNYIKAYLRRAVARVNLSNISGSIKDYEEVLKREQWNKEAKRELEKLRKENQEISSASQKSSECLPENAQQKIVEGSENFPQHTKDAYTLKKPIHLQSTKPLIEVPVVEVNSREEVEETVTRRKNKPPLENIVASKVSEKVPSVNDKVEVIKPSLPLIPKTSHQFAQDWQKIKKYEDLLLEYLKKVPSSFFKSVEIEVDLLVEVIETLCSNNFESKVAATIMTSLINSRGFFLNIAFLETSQKKAFENIIRKIENCELNEDDKNSLNLLKNSL